MMRKYLKCLNDIVTDLCLHINGMTKKHDKLCQYICQKRLN